MKVSGSKKGGGWRQIGNLVGGGGGGADPYRYGLFDPEKRVNLRDRMALIVDVREVMEGGVVVLVGDFGMFFYSWRGGGFGGNGWEDWVEDYVLMNPKNNQASKYPGATST